MIVSIDSRSSVPPFEQLRAQITTMIVTGVLPVNERLPTIRQLATDLKLAPGTVSRAVRELENDGLIETRGHRGTFVLGRRPKVSTSTRRSQLADAAREFAVKARQLGVSTSIALSQVERALGDLDSKRD